MRKKIDSESSMKSLREEEEELRITVEATNDDGVEVHPAKVRMQKKERQKRHRRNRQQHQEVLRVAMSVLALRLHSRNGWCSPER